jgi:histidine decarboxylase
MSERTAMTMSERATVSIRTPKSIDSLLSQKLEEFRIARRDHLGYPYNLDFQTGTAARFANFLINNLGDPYTGSHYATELCDLERDVVAWFMRLWGCEYPDEFWGSVGASGTEGNIWALYLAREAHPTAVVLHSEDAHYSIPKAAKILRMETVSVASEKNGALSMDAFASAVAGQQGRPVIVTLNCGSTVKGAHDDISQALAVLDSSDIERDRRFVHVDGALNAMVLPFDSEAPNSIKPSFGTAIDSISTSGHKMIGTSMPCGVLVVRRDYVAQVSSAISYLRTNDTTLMGSRNGHAVLALWERLYRHGASGFTRDVRDCLKRSRWLATTLRAAGVPVLLNPHSITVVFPEPAHDLVRRFQLACHQQLAHAVVMPNVSDALTDRFARAYIDWWRSANRPVPVASLTAEAMVT